MQAKLEAMQDAAVQRMWAAKARAATVLADAHLPSRMEAAAKAVSACSWSSQASVLLR